MPFARRAAARILPLLALLAPLLAPLPARAQASAHLPLTDPVYRDLDRIAAWGLVDTVAVARRPWSRMEAADLVVQALRNRPRLASSPALAATADALLGRLSHRLAPELARLGVRVEDGTGPAGALTLDGARVDLTWTDGVARNVPDNDVGTVDARLNPLVAYQEGRALVEGATAGLEVELRGGLGSHVAWSLRPRVEGTVAAGDVADVRKVSLQAGEARLQLGNAAFTVGREAVVWGPSPTGGLILSTNPGPLTRVSVANEAPVRLPWVLGALGPSWHQAFYADLGTEAQRFAHSYLFGFRSSFQPVPVVELGLEFLVESGGTGSPAASFGDRVLDHLFFPDLFLSRDLTFSNKMAGVDLRVRAPGAAGLEAYVEGVLDDIDIDRLKSMLWQDGGWLVGVHAARLDDAGRVGLRVEGEHTGLRFYRHEDFVSGLQLDRHVLGSELGPDANGVRAKLTFDPEPSRAFAVEGAFERRSDDHYVFLIGHPYYFSRSSILPKERRVRVVATWEERRQGPGSWRLRLQAGWERTDHFAFARNDTRNALLASLVVEARPW